MYSDRDRERNTAKWYILAQLAEATHAATVAEAEAEVQRRVRDEVIRRARMTGLSLKEIATLTGLSKSRVQQLAGERVDGEVGDGELVDVVLKP